MADSIADRFIITMAELNALGDLCDNSEPMRHQMRMYKMYAEQQLDQAIRMGWEIAMMAKRLPQDAKEAADEAVKLAIEQHIKAAAPKLGEQEGGV